MQQLPRGVTVALQILDLFVMVRIHARQPLVGYQWFMKKLALPGAVS
jgi:hypothetical protein